MRITLSIIILFINSLSIASATTANNFFIKDYVEKGNKSPQEESAEYQEYKKQGANSQFLESGLRKNYSEYSNRITPPGLISARPISRIAKIIGSEKIQYFLGDTVFLHWFGAPGPKEGAVFSIYSPAVVLQNIDNPTDFIARRPKAEHESWPEGFRPAGYMYDTNGELKITKISAGLVEAVITNIRGVVSLDDEIMLPMPRYQSIKPIPGSYQITASVVSGSPYERLTTMPHNFVYINRGSRDGIKIGRIFEAVESVKIQGSDTLKQNRRLGEAIVVFVSDAFSTAMIVDQFELIHVGSLLKTKTVGAESAEKFTLRTGETLPFVPNSTAASMELFETHEKPLAEKSVSQSMERLQKNIKLSELDELEKRESIKSLTAEEKNRLNQLNTQESASKEAAPSAESAATVDINSDTPSLPPPPSAFVQGKNVAQKDKKKAAKKDKKKARDEEELNQLMMQN